MNLEYEISEQDFIHAQHLAIKNSPIRFIRWTRFVLPVFGAALLLFLVRVIVQQGFSWRLIPASLFPVVFLLAPVLNRWESKRAYAKNAGLHGRLSLVADGTGLRLQGATFSAQINWAHFCRFLEDQNSFLLYQSPQVFNIVPKRGLDPSQIDGLRAFLKANITPAR